MNDMANHKLKWGKYKGKHLKDVPDDYLQWILTNQPNIFKGKMLIYVKNKLNLPKNKYQITVEDSIGTDGIYEVEAYTSNQAINTCKKQFKIQNTQSFHGTSYNIKLIQ